MELYTYLLFAIMLMIIIAEKLLLVKKSNEIKKIIEFVSSGKVKKGIPKEFVNVYKSKLDLIEKQFKNEISKLKSENQYLQKEIEESRRMLDSHNSEFKEQLHTIFDSVKELAEAFKVVVDEINEVLVKNLEDMTQRSNKVEDDIRNGRVQVSKSVEDINILLGQMQELLENVVNLSVHIENMSKVTQIISDIVKEISFISLNAQIEANKVKDSMAFSLLASEMRKLADSGKQSLKEVNKTISNIVEDINTNSIRINTFVSKLEELKNRTNEITDEFESVHRLISSVLHYQNQLSDQVKQHFAGIQEIVGVLENIYNEGVQILEKSIAHI
ncbi:methyl-accepting chemotaxis sensory transducer [Caldicellulosiruptor kronotskyensis 2002]|uniref:Methyl-accepting chemotaxis sensory transducer n=1 Tax=Caldicellulosiruptor kronotskyensis (strain DSM 18902 / VKM B-2412 / 2002) TaxID=632348 RepID=E4SGL8_CALK2|nr:methyl-accepting chemotaxis protein [Caldicellulosiruptor kronotskyensis]ADQ46893.1 methyl-accepting chemotaxis sensory transducer [Caldicellulosiruptor kronotskyensis 2002]